MRMSEERLVKQTFRVNATRRRGTPRTRCHDGVENVLSEEGMTISRLRYTCRIEKIGGVYENAPKK